MTPTRISSWKRASDTVNYVILGALIAFVLWTTFVRP